MASTNNIGDERERREKSDTLSDAATRFWLDYYSIVFPKKKKNCTNQNGGTNEVKYDFSVLLHSFTRLHLTEKNGWQLAQEESKTNEIYPGHAGTITHRETFNLSK